MKHNNAPSRFNVSDLALSDPRGPEKHNGYKQIRRYELMGYKLTTQT